MTEETDQHKAENIESLRRLAAERSHSDAKSANDLFRAAHQAVILINGGAATAILTEHLETPFSVIALCFYALGVAFGAWGLLASADATQEYLNTWQIVATTKRTNTNSEEGNKFHLRARRYVQGSVACFVAGCASIAGVFVMAFVGC